METAHEESFFKFGILINTGEILIEFAGNKTSV
jgi:hypothetical protein